jgi:hypothetical protein
MLIRIAEIGEYDMDAALRHPTLNDLFYLKVKTRSEEYPKGVGLKVLGEYLEKFTQLESPSDLLEDADSLLALRCLVFLCRRAAGERLTIDEANDFPLEAFEFVIEDSDQPILEAANPPVAPPTSEAGDELPAVVGPTGSPTT